MRCEISERKNLELMDLSSERSAVFHFIKHIYALILFLFLLTIQKI